MYRSATLSKNHYAYKWVIPTAENLNNRVTVNNLGIKYAGLPAGQEKQDIQLEVMKCFHAYTLKYLNMIIKGTLPALNTKAGKECVAFLKTLIPAGSTMKLNKINLTPICRTLHLAFKQQTTDEIYDALAMCMIRSINKYDPTYTDKIIKICKVIDTKITSYKRKKDPKPEYEFTIEQISNELGYDCTAYIRLLATKGFIQSIKNSKGRVAGYKRKEWPPKKSFFQSGPIAFVYFVPQHFRYYLHEYISKEMTSIECKEGVFQYEHRTIIGSGSGEVIRINDAALPGINGNFTDRNGTQWHADLGLVNHQLDISTMTMDWVKETNDRLFKKLTVKERHILYMVFVKEMTWVDIAAVLDCERATAKKHFVKVMKYLQARAGQNKPDEKIPIDIKVL